MKFALLHAYFHYKMDGTTYRNNGIVSPESRYRRAGLVAQLVPEYSLLADAGIGGEEVLLLEPSTEGTQIKLATDYNDIRALLEQGLSAADAILPKITQFSSLPLWQELDE